MIRAIGGVAAALAGAAGLLAAAPAHADDAPRPDPGPVQFTAAGEHLFTVPDGVYALHVAAVGARGVSAMSPGGVGARAEGDVVVMPGLVLYVEVGGAGGNTVPYGGRAAIGAGGFNGGGTGGWADWKGQVIPGLPVPPLSGAGGGGASGLQLCPISTCGDSSRHRQSLLVAGGGGG
ncbi:hypothetical protein [Dactylosporangium matsuzakiense]|uniref:Uncharacterized protein n=1 Tax=Dactylosporangium matsuzakiense TaxID=53360 RepID=A0A9W6KLI0_9ACTN|nr:hypothetical protein [Dactylosporangium matsuzakiense]UWZ47952.1 hypothetical protein Dmats_17060 [Dactylosporangium matsuzakiense]GLL04292.1 hypothetical protein GCM10017581_060390 [Dactylosporangium matsuzakiense]